MAKKRNPANKQREVASTKWYVASEHHLIDNKLYMVSYCGLVCKNGWRYLQPHELDDSICKSCRLAMEGA